jgi:hypothetical protein
MNLFAGLAIGTNLYSSGDEVAANPNPADGDFMPSPWSMIPDNLSIWWDSELGHRAWVANEKAKGGRPDGHNPVGETVAMLAQRANSVHCGWEFNERWNNNTAHGGQPWEQLTAAQATEARVPTAALAAEPFFAPFRADEDGTYYPGYNGAALLAPVGDATASLEASKLSTFAKLLAEAIPALSFAQAANPSAKFTRDLGKNFNLNTDYNPDTGLGFKNGWPVSREADHNWKHSDYLAVAYNFIFPLFDKIVKDGGLNP